jgi:hypothetical protein
MIDLKELEKRLDEALAKETTDSLNHWLNNQRTDSLVSYFGECVIDSLPGKPFSFSIDLPSINHFVKLNDNNIPTEADYDLAA